MQLTTTKIPFSTPVLVISVAAPLGVLGAVLLGSTAPTVWAVVVLVGTAVLVAGVMLPARHWLEIRDDEVRLHYRPLLTRRIATRDVVRFQLIERVHPLRYGGVGLRIASGKVVAFVNRAGPALLIEPSRGWSSLIVLASPEEAEAVRRRLEETTGRTVERRGA